MYVYENKLACITRGYGSADVDMDTACMLLVRARHYLDIIAWMDRFSSFLFAFIMLVPSFPPVCTIKIIRRIPFWVGDVRYLVAGVNNITNLHG